MSTVVVRRAFASDRARILEMALAFYATTHYAKMESAAEPPEGSIEQLIDQLLQPPHILLVAVDDGAIVGMVALFCSPHVFNRSIGAAHEVAWWVEPTARGRAVGAALLDGAESAARDLGAAYIQMIALPESPEAATTAYALRGYRLTEFSYTKRL